VGKIDRRIFETFVRARLGRPDPSVIVPPRTGIDAGVIAIGGGRVLVVAEDPIFAVPGQPWEIIGWYTVHIGASDVAVMGAVPQYMTYTLLLPPGTPDVELTAIVDSIHRAADELGIAIVGGHTGYYPGLAAPTIGGVTVFAFADEEEIITPAGARPGDRVILTKGPAIEAAGLLAVVRETDLKGRHPAALVERAKTLVHQITVVKDATVARSAGTVTAMHDATEGGVIGGLAEIAEASGVGMEIDEAAMVYPDEVRIVCEALDLDPIAAIAEGSLLVTVNAGDADAVIAALRAAGIAASVIGTVGADPAKRTIRRRDGTVEAIVYPPADPFWPVFFGSLEGRTGREREPWTM
jgi:hydrogenase maturation factor